MVWENTPPFPDATVRPEIRCGKHGIYQITRVAPDTAFRISPFFRIGSEDRGKMDWRVGAEKAGVVECRREASDIYANTGNLRKRRDSAFGADDIVGGRVDRIDTAAAQWEREFR